MKIKELIYNTPEITEEKLLEVINKHLNHVRKGLKDRIITLHKDSEKPFDLAEAFLDEYDLIQDKNSFLTKSQRDFVIGLVGACMIEMVKGKESNGGDNTESTSSDRVELVSHVEEVGNNSN